MLPVRGARCHYPSSGHRAISPSGPQHPQGEVELVLQDILTLCLTSYPFLAKHAARDTSHLQAQQSSTAIRSTALKSTPHPTATIIVCGPIYGYGYIAQVARTKRKEILHPEFMVFTSNIFVSYKCLLLVLNTKSANGLFNGLL